jgi:hypothetical protein
MDSENKIRKIIKYILNEATGKQMTVHDSIPVLIENLLNNINGQKYNVFDGEIYDLTSRARFLPESSQETGINYVTIDVTFSVNAPMKITGSFINRKTTLNKNGFYDVFIEISLNTGGIKLKKLEKDIGKVISHELNHAFVYIKKFKRNSKTLIYNKSNKTASLTFGNVPALKEFSKMFYLNLPEEIQARVQETAYILDNIEVNNYNDAIRELYLHQPINDAKKMSNYNIEDIQIVDKNTLRNFVDTFNSDVEKNKGNIEFKRINDIDKFFEYWIGFINSNGNKLNKKILKLVADKFNLKENTELSEMDVDLLNEIFGAL